MEQCNKSSLTPRKLIYRKEAEHNPLSRLQVHIYCVTARYSSEKSAFDININNPHFKRELSCTSRPAPS